jgi:membrane protein DedA with SNARE-associated domain
MLPTAGIVFAGFMIRDSLAWTLGNQLGERILGARWFQRVITPGRIDSARRLVRDRGPTAVLGGRLMVGMRAPVFIVAGASGLPYRQFIYWDTIGMVITTPTLLALGYYVGPPVVSWAESALPWVRNALMIAIGCAVAIAWWRRHRASGSST